MYNNGKWILSQFQIRYDVHSCIQHLWKFLLGSSVGFLSSFLLFDLHLPFSTLFTRTLLLSLFQSVFRPFSFFFSFTSIPFIYSFGPLYSLITHTFFSSSTFLFKPKIYLTDELRVFIIFAIVKMDTKMIFHLFQDIIKCQQNRY